MLKTAYKVEKPWGYEEVWASSHRYVGKILFIKNPKYEKSSIDIKLYDIYKGKFCFII